MYLFSSDPRRRPGDGRVYRKEDKMWWFEGAGGNQEKEKQLSVLLERIHVVRQAYHSNAIVGNHRMLILKNYLQLITVLLHSPEEKNKFDLFKCFL